MTKTPRQVTRMVFLGDEWGQGGVRTWRVVGEVEGCWTTMPRQGVQETMPRLYIHHVPSGSRSMILGSWFLVLGVDLGVLPSAHPCFR